MCELFNLNNILSLSLCGVVAYSLYSGHLPKLIFSGCFHLLKIKHKLSEWREMRRLPTITTYDDKIKIKACINGLNTILICHNIHKICNDYNIIVTENGVKYYLYTVDGFDSFAPNNFEFSKICAVNNDLTTQINLTSDDLVSADNLAKLNKELNEEE